MRFMKNSKTVLIFLAGLLTGFVFSVVFLPSYFTERAPKDGEDTVSTMIDSGEKIIICKDEATEGSTAFDLLKSCSEEKNSSLILKSMKEWEFW